MTTAEDFFDAMINKERSSAMPCQSCLQHSVYSGRLPIDFKATNSSICGDVRFWTVTLRDLPWDSLPCYLEAAAQLMREMREPTNPR
jgi:hypothetical protein